MLKVVGIITQNAALSSILSMMLKDCLNVRVRVFETPKALAIYLRIAPVHLLISDYHLEETSCPKLASVLKSNPRMHTENMQIIALSESIDGHMQKAIGAVGIDEIIIKPMSPAYIKERVDARLALPSRYRRTPAPKSSLAQQVEFKIDEQDTTPQYSGNVIPLFGKSEPEDNQQPFH